MYSIIKSIDEIPRYYESEGWKPTHILQGTRLVMPEHLGRGYLDFLGDIGTCYFIRADFRYNEDYIVRYILKERYIEISWTAASEVIAYQNKAQPYPIETGLNIFINAFPLQLFGKIPKNTTVSYCSIFIRESFLKQHNITLPPSFWEAGVRILNPDVISYPLLYALVQQTANLEIAKEAYELVLKGVAIQALGLLVQYLDQHKSNYRHKVLGEKDMQAVLQCKKVLDSNFVNPPVVKHLCKIAGINKNKLQAGFLQITGLTISEYLRSKRMEKAIELLEKGDMRIDDIAASVGYQSPANFYKAFGKTFGLTPRQMRGMLKKI